ncbi:MAG TPA: mucoidy inhibitor MuiA family protein [Hyphomicrobium sp.]|nr:mucoidy inhibitor MuiA family protein [Hyphomicrobium sp.]
MQNIVRLSLLVAFSAQAGAADISATSKVDAVTVFLSGAEVMRLAKVKLDKGDHTIAIVDIPASAVPGSIRVEGNATGKLDISSVDTRRTFLARQDAQAADQERRSLEDQIEALRDQKASADAQVAAAETQRMLISNLAQLPTRPAPAAAGAAGEDWQRVLSLIAQGSSEASRAMIEAQAKARALERQIEDLENKLSLLAPAKTEQTEVKVHVGAASPLEADLIVRYQVANASWTPLYDARLNTGSKTAPAALVLARRASITQSTGEDWPQSQIELSTARPSAGASAPGLQSQTVDFEPEVRPVPMAKASRTMAREDSEDERMSGQMPSEIVAAAPPAAPEAEPVHEQHAALTVAPFEATFAVPGRVSIAGTGEAKRVVLMTESIEPKLFCRTVPKADAKAYLYARLSFAKGTPLLPGQVFLFRDGTFVGTGSVPLLSPGESHDLGFGIDDQVKVRHAVLEEKRGETGLISSSRTDVRNYRVTVKNMHERPIQLEVIDQVPVALNQDIKVDYTGRIQPAKTNLEDKRGVMSFEAKLEPDEEKVFEYGYKIAWPAAKGIVYGQ